MLQCHCGDVSFVDVYIQGTDLSKNNLRRSHAFSEKKGLAQYNRVLHPRTTGLRLFFDECKEMGVDYM